MATTKTASAEENEAPKKQAITFAKDLTASEKMEALNAAKKALEEEVLNELETQKKDLEVQLADVNGKIEAIVGKPYEHPAARVGRPKKEKTPGIQVSANALTERIKATKDGVLNIRSEKLDIPTVKKLAEEHPDKFKVNVNGPWPTVSLA